MSDSNSAPNGDKRSVSTDALATLGTIIGPSEKRDAIHLAVIPAIASTRMKPGTHVALHDDMAYPADPDRSWISKDLVGIVDPFLAEPVEEQQRFWLIIYPRVINSLRHVWTHPRIRDEIINERVPYDAEASEKWLRDFCQTGAGPRSYDDLMIAVRGGTIHSGYGPCQNDGEYLTIMGSDAHGEIPAGFWDHVEAVTGLKNLPRASYFSCSC